MYTFYRDKTGCYIRHDQFEKIRWVIDDEGKRHCQFTHRNLKKQNAIRLGQIWTAKKLPDEIKHYKMMGHYVKVPAGISGFTNYDFTLNYASEIIEHPNILRASYDYQTSAVQDLLTRSVGLLHASTGSGKTQMISEIIVRLKRKSLIMVQNLTQMQQMVADITNILGVTPVQVSGKKPSKREQESWYPHITVCSIDSRDKIQPSEYGLILLDEADTYLGSDDRREWVGNLSPEYLYAMTGTIKINHVDDDIFRLYYGPKTELKLHHHTPEYKQVYSDFEYFLDDIKEFHELKSALYGDHRRNELIVNTTMKFLPGRKAVVFTEHIEHANYLSEQFKAHGKIVYTLIGEVSKDDRERIRQEAKDAKGEVILVGSVKILGRGFDLPELSLGVLTTSERFESNLDQYIGRIIRQFEGKPNPVFIDIVDHLTGVLLNQSRSRLKNFKKKFPDGKITTG